MPQIELGGVSSNPSPLYRQLSQNESDEDELVRFQSPPRTSSVVSTTAKYSPTPRLDHHPILVTPHRTGQMYLNHSASITSGISGGHNILLDLDVSSSSDRIAVLNDGGINSTNAQDDESGHIMAVRKPMGPCRKFCFCLSIFVCCASVAIFLWGLPCHTDSMSCPLRRSDPNQAGEDVDWASHNWIRDFEKVEFKGMISVTPKTQGYGKNIIFMYRGDRSFEKASDHQHSPKDNGIISLMGRGGQIGWYDRMTDEPSNIDCGILDVDKNGVPDCLVIDEYGQLGSIDPISGNWNWHISLYQDQNNSSDRGARRKAIDLLDFPLILPDVIDDDHVNDLLLVTSLEQAHHNNFLFVSGAHGRPLGNAYTLTSCEFIHKLQIERETSNLLFNCINNETEVTKVWSLPQLFRLATQKEFPAEKLKAAHTIEQHKFYGQRKNTQSQRNIYSNGAAELIVENSGKCAYNCTMTIAVRESDKSPPTVVVQGKAMYGMVPAVFIPRKRGGWALSGFVIKFWDWEEQEEDEVSSIRMRREAYPHHVNWTYVKNERWTKHVKREDAPAMGAVNSNDLVQRKLKEHVLLIVFNGTATHKVINTSQSDITQFCREVSGFSTCQPDVNYQENSITIADLDNDGSNDQELISYYSTFVQQPNKDWKLVTYVSQFRLEKELASLYDT